MGDSIVSVLTKIAAVAGQSHIVGVLRNERNIYNNNFGLKVRHDIEVQLLNVKLLKWLLPAHYHNTWGRIFFQNF